MLLGSFYTITESNTEDNGFNAKLKLNPAHEIFRGHFPGNPVVPGVCQIQMVQELLQHVCGGKEELMETGFIKFLQTVNPLTDDTIYVQVKVEPLEGGKLQISANYDWDNKTCFKFKGFFQ